MDPRRFFTNLHRSSTRRWLALGGVWLLGFAGLAPSVARATDTTITGNFLVDPTENPAGFTSLAPGDTLSVTGGAFFGNTSDGRFTQTGGVFNVQGNALLGAAALNGPGNGFFTLTNGTLSLGGDLAVGNGGTGSFVQNGGSVTANAAGRGLVIGGNVAGGRAGQYTLNGGSLATGRSLVALGSFVLNGGIFSTGSQTLYVGYVANNEGDFFLQGGTLTVGNVALLKGTGAFNFDGGTLQAQNDSTAFFQGLTTANVRNGGAVINSNNHSVTVAQALLHSGISGDNAIDGGLTKRGAGALTLGAANTFNGSTRIAAGSLALTNASALQNSTLDLNASDVGTLAFGTLTTATLGGLQGSRSLSWTSPLTLDVGGNNASTTYSGALGGTFVILSKNGTGALTLTGANTYGGGTQLNAGTLRAGGSSVFGTNSVFVNSGTLDLNGQPGIAIEIEGTDGAIVNNAGGNLTLTLTGLSYYTGVIADTNAGASGALAVVIGSNQKAVLAGVNTYTGGTTINAGGVLQLGDGSAPAPNVIVGPVVDNGTLVYNAINGPQSQTTATPAVSGAGGLLKGGSGDLFVTADCTYTGGTIIGAVGGTPANTGTLHPPATASAVFGSANGGLTVNSGTVALAAAGGPQTLSIGALNGAGGVIMAASTGAKGNVLSIGNGDVIGGSFAGNIQNSSTSASAITLGLVKTGGARQTLTGTNTYTGGTSVNSGILRLTVPAALPVTGSIAVANGATLMVSTGGTGQWSAANVDALRARANFAVGAALGLDTADSTAGVTYGSNIAGVLGLTKAGASTTLTLTGASTYTGATAVRGGTLIVASGASLGNTAVSVSSGAAFTNHGTVAGAADIAGTASGGGTFGGAVTVQSGGVFSGQGTINGAFTVNAGGLVTLAAGTLTAKGGVINNGTIRLTRGAALALAGNGNFTNNGTLDIISGSLSGATNFTGSGAVLDAGAVRAAGVSWTASAVTVSVTGYSGHSYQLQRSNAPGPGTSYTNVGNPQTGSAGATLTFTDASPAAGQGFYRVAVDL